MLPQSASLGTFRPLRENADKKENETVLEVSITFSSLQGVEKREGGRKLLKTEDFQKEGEREKLGRG